MTDTSGFRASDAEAIFELLVENGAVVRLLDERIEVDDDLSTVVEATGAQATTERDQWEIETADAFDEPHQLRNDSSITFDDPGDIGVVEQIVVEEATTGRTGVLTPDPGVGDELVVTGERDPIARPGDITLELGGIDNE